MQGVPEGEAPACFARVGLAMALVPRFQEVSWYGLGPHETYPDSVSAGRLGRYRASVEQMETPYVVPQENGHRSRDPAGASCLMVTRASSWLEPLFSGSAPTAGRRPPWPRPVTATSW